MTRLLIASFALVLLGLLASGSVALQEPPKAVEDRQQAENAQQTRADQSTPVSGPFVPSPARPVPSNSEQDKTQQETNRWPDWIVAGATVAIAVLTYVYARYSRRQWEAMQDQLEIARRQSDISSGQLEVTQDTARRQLRAYLTVERVQLPEDIRTTTRPIATVVIKNGGITPAYDFHGWAVMRPHAFPAPEGFFRKPPDEEEAIPEDLEVAVHWKSSSKGVVGPGTPISMPARMIGTDSEAWRTLFGTKTVTLYVWGELYYRDAFSAVEDNRWTKFRFRYGPDRHVAPPYLLAVDSEGNDAN